MPRPGYGQAAVRSAVHPDELQMGAPALVQALLVPVPKLPLQLQVCSTDSLTSSTYKPEPPPLKLWNANVDEVDPAVKVPPTVSQLLLFATVDELNTHVLLLPAPDDKVTAPERVPAERFAIRADHTYVTPAVVLTD